MNSRRGFSEEQSEYLEKFWNNWFQNRKGRWTKKSLIDWEQLQFRPLISKSRTVLDLGCGKGELLKRITDKFQSVTGVDRALNLENYFKQDSHITFELADVRYFKSSKKYDAVLCFGVLSSFDSEESFSFLESVESMMKPDGIFLLKNQFSKDHDHIIIDKYSNELQQRYVAFYPSRNSIRNYLEKKFNVIEEITYPEQFQTQRDTIHLAFVCTGLKKI